MIHLLCDLLRIQQVEDEGIQPDELENEVNELSVLLEILLESRYAAPRFLGSAGSLSHSIDEFLRLPSHTFLTNFRMPPDAFYQLATILEETYGNEFWQGRRTIGRRGPRGMGVMKQLLVGLYFLGSDGATIDKLRLEMKLGKGTCHMFLWRVIEALAGLAPQYIRWPGIEEQQQLYRPDGFKECIGYLDGSEMWLRVGNRPQRAHETYFSRKKRYGFNLQAICNPRKEFIYAHAGMKASTHDSTAFKSSRLYAERQQLFHRSAYILADKAYEIDRHVLTPFKENAIGDRQHHTAFNQAVTNERIHIEHAFGILKNRWPSLRSIPVSIRKEKDNHDHNRVVNWIFACLVLHNFLRRYGLADEINEGFDEERAEENVEEEVAQPQVAGVAQNDPSRGMKRMGEERRNELARQFFLHS